MSRDEISAQIDRRRSWYWHKKHQQRLDGETAHDSRLRERAAKMAGERMVADLTRGGTK